MTRKTFEETITQDAKTGLSRPNLWWKINKYMITDFTNKLSNESWDTIFNSDNVNTIHF
jgi:hypothetical protein